jgi:hypothetical protein
MAPEQARDTRQATSASDIYALGATMLFAATGHPPYQGETVMDVLVQLATGPPDLGDLPTDLTEVVAGCLERDPRHRPTSASLLARLAPELAATAEPGATPLPTAALALIEEYRALPRAPLPARPNAAPAMVAGRTDDTVGSQLGLGYSAARAANNGGGDRRDRRRWQPWLTRGTRPAMVAAVAVVLVGVSWLAGWFTAGAGAASGRPSGTSTSLLAGASASARQSAQLGPVIAQPPPAGGGTGYRQSPPPNAPFQTLADATPGIPAIGVSQPIGDGNTVFIIRGQWWPVGKPVTITLAGVGTSPAHPIVDQNGSFNYAINQGHEFFADGLPAGTYTIRVTDATGASAQARFEVM